MKKLFLSLFLTLSAYTQSANAIVLIGNYPPANNDFISPIAIFSGSFPPLGESTAVGFTLPAGTSYSLDSVQLRLDRTDLDATMTLRLFGGTPAGPTTPALVDFAIPAFGLGVAADVVFTPQTPFTLAPSTTYWIAASGSSPTIFGIVWRGSDPGVVPTGVATATAGSTFGLFDYPPTTLVAGVFPTYLVNGTATGSIAVPDGGSSVAFLALSAAGLVCLRRKLTS